MTQRQRGRRGSRGSSVARKTIWIDSLINIVFAAPETKIVNLTSTLTTGVRGGSTVTRLIFDFTYHHSLTTNAICLMSYGFFMGTTEGIAAVAVPDPETSGDNPGGMYRGQMVIP